MQENAAAFFLAEKLTKEELAYLEEIFTPENVRCSSIFCWRKLDDLRNGNKKHKLRRVQVVGARYGAAAGKFSHDAHKKL